MRALSLAIVVLAATATLDGQQPEGAPVPGRVHAAVRTPDVPLKITTVPLAPDPSIRRFGIVTLLPPDANGQVIRASLPVGELVMRTGQAVVAAQHRRAQGNAQAAVVRELREYQTRDWSQSTKVLTAVAPAVAGADLSGRWTLHWAPDFSGHDDEYDCTCKQSGEQLTLTCRDTDPAMTGELVERRVTLRFKAGRDGSQTATLTGELTESATAIMGTWHLAAPDNRDGKFTMTKQ